MNDINLNQLTSKQIKNVIEAINNKHLVQSKTPQISYELPPEFKWCTLDPQSNSDMLIVSTFLNMHYVEDIDNDFRLNYSSNFLSWALQSTYVNNNDLCVSIKILDSNEIVGFISGSMINVHIDGIDKIMADINFLCVHSKLRNKNISSLLIKEITRRINLKGYFHAIYTGANQFSNSICTANIFHRPLNVQKLIETKLLN